LDQCSPGRVQHRGKTKLRARKSEGSREKGIKKNEVKGVVIKKYKDLRRQTMGD